MKRGSPLRRTPLKRGRRKPRPSLAEFHAAVIARAGGCEMASPECFGRLWGHHFIPKQRLTDVQALDPRNGVALCIHHHAQVENARERSPRPPDLAGFLDDHNLSTREAA